ncbi:MAG: transglutaminase family protein [Undibacterium sp.]|nr:transglutaminase family protein [Undibacterium sp.]
MKKILQKAPIAHYRVVHQTSYSYQSVVTLSQQYLHLSPRSFAYQEVTAEELRIEPSPSECTFNLDYFGNKTHNITIAVPHQTLLAHAEFTVLLRPRYSLSEIAGSCPWETVRDRRSIFAPNSTHEPQLFLYPSPHVSCAIELREYALKSYHPGRAHLDAALDLTQRIFNDFEFDDKATEISTPLEDVLQGRRGVCQDFAHLMIGCLRSLGLAARYVSGYILTHPPEGELRMIGADASHAWVSVFCPTFGWVDFDPTNSCLVQNEHITLGWGRDFSDVTPMRGVVLGGDKHNLQVNVTVSPLGTMLSGKPIV